MFGPSFGDYYRTALEKFKQDLLHESDLQILGSSTGDLANFYFQKYCLVPLEFDPAAIAYEIRKEVRRVPAHRRDEFYRNEGDTQFEYEVAIISIPIETCPNLDWIKKLGGNMRTLDGFDESIDYGQNEISYSFDIKGYGFQQDENQVANEVNNKSQRLISTLTDKNNNIDSENTKFLQAIKEVIEQRKAKLIADKEKLDSLTQKIKIPIRQKASASSKKIPVDVKNFVRIVKPTPRLPEEYTLEESVLGEILTYVENQCRSFEKTPASYKQLGEEQLRDIILAALNGIFEGNATGETFVKKGKTDIHLKIEKGEILIFECKIWGGEKLFLETIDQLTGYVTWRQNYGVLIIFCRNRDFSKILAQVPGVIPKHSQYVRGYKRINDSHFVSEHSLPEDNGKVIKIHHLVYNLFSD